MSIFLAIAMLAGWQGSAISVSGEVAMTNVYDFTMQDIDGKSVTFPMFSKISVKGKNIHPLYEFLTSKKANPGFGGAIAWNFNKFLIGRDGVIVERFGSRTTPDDKELVEAVLKALKMSN